MPPHANGMREGPPAAVARGVPGTRGPRTRARPSPALRRARWRRLRARAGSRRVCGAAARRGRAEAHTLLPAAQGSRAQRPQGALRVRAGGARRGPPRRVRGARADLAAEPRARLFSERLLAGLPAAYEAAAAADAGGAGKDIYVFDHHHQRSRRGVRGGVHRGGRGGGRTSSSSWVLVNPKSPLLTVGDGVV